MQKVYFSRLMRVYIRQWDSPFNNVYLKKYVMPCWPQVQQFLVYVVGLAAKKEWVKRGTNQFTSTSYTLGTLKRLLSCFKFEKKMESF